MSKKPFMIVAVLAVIFAMGFGCSFASLILWLALGRPTDVSSLFE